MEYKNTNIGEFEIHLFLYKKNFSLKLIIGEQNFVCSINCVRHSDFKYSVNINFLKPPAPNLCNTL